MSKKSKNHQRASFWNSLPRERTLGKSPSALEILCGEKVFARKNRLKGRRKPKIKKSDDLL